MKLKNICMRVGALASAFLIGITPVNVYAMVDEAAVVEEDIASPEPEKEPEKEEKFGPLTPDGNMTLVDDYGSEKSGKQFITVVTKSGNYFYIVIDRDDNGEETVHFLNLVDEADLLSLMDEEAVDKYIAVTSGKQEVVEEKKEPEPEKKEEPVVEQPTKKIPNFKPLLYIFPLAGIGVIAAYVLMQKKKKKTPPPQIDPDIDYTDDEEDYLASLSDDDDYEGDLDEDLDDDFEVTDLRQQIVEAEEDTDE